MSHAIHSARAARPTPPSRSRTRDLLVATCFIGFGLLVGASYLEAAEDGDSTTDVDPAVDSAAVEAAWKQGYDLQRAKQTDAAIVAYEAALALDPNHSKSLYEVGWSYWVLGRWSDVVRVWERVLELEPEHEEVPRYIDEARTKQALRARLEQGDATSGSPESVPRQEGTAVRFALGGDTMMGSPLSAAGLPANDGADLFAAYSDTMKAADIAFLNLEGVLLDSGRSYKCPEDSEKGCYAFRMPVRYVKNLTGAGIDVVSFANNHANDYQAAGRKSTTDALDGAGIQVAGPLDRQAILDVNGVKVGVVGFATSPLGGDLRDIPVARAMVADMASKVDLVVVSFHGGAEGKKAQHVPEGRETFMGENRGDLRAFTHAMVDAGADLLVGHGPHVLRGMEIYKERLIAYSLGNFITYGGFNLSGANGLTALLEVDLHPDGRLAGATIHSGRQISPGGPRLDSEHEAAAMVRTLSLADFPETAPTITDDGRITP